MEILKHKDENKKSDDNHYYGGPAAIESSGGYGRKRMMGLQNHRVHQPLRLPDEDQQGWAYSNFPDYEMRKMRDEPIFKSKNSAIFYDSTPPKGYEKLLKNQTFKAKLARKMKRRKMRMN